jgi:hypothetical protein
VEWSRGRLTYNGKKTTDKECVWYSPACRKPEMARDLFSFDSCRIGTATKQSALFISPPAPAAEQLPFSTP